jgi:hypothetical protein
VFVIRNAARAAGCHLYTEETAVYADSRLLGVPNGTGKVFLPGAHDVRDCRTGKQVASGASELEPGTARGTGLYALRKRVHKAHEGESGSVRRRGDQGD